MECTHPVLYSRDGVLYCQICGAILPLETLTAPKAESPKTETRRKRKAKT